MVHLNFLQNSVGYDIDFAEILYFRRVIAFKPQVSIYNLDELC